MAKSSRSKWKKLHKRQRAQEIATVVVKRVGRLNEKLRLAAEGGLSKVPMEDPETRFHFVNPEMDMNVPHNPKGPNNNYNDLIRESLDFSKPLQLRPPKTNFNGKRNRNAPHPMTQQYDVVNAVAPIAGHAISVKDVEHMDQEAEQRSAKFHANEEESVERHVAKSDDNEMEEFVLGCNDAMRETTANTKSVLLGSLDATKKKSKRTGTGKVEVAPRRVGKMKNSATKKNSVGQITGDKKAKRLSNALPTRLAQSGSVTTKRHVTAGK